MGEGPELNQKWKRTGMVIVGHVGRYVGCNLTRTFQNFNVSLMPSLLKLHKTTK